MIYQYMDTDGNLLSDAEVWVYRAHGTGESWYTKVYEDTPAIKTIADSSGQVTLDISMFTDNGRIEHTYGFSNSVALVRVTYKGQHYFLFEEATDPSLAYNLGNKDSYVFKRQIKLRTGEPSPSEWKIDEKWEPAGISFALRQ